MRWCLLASVLLVPTAAAQAQLDLRVSVLLEPLKPGEPIQGSYVLDVEIPPGETGNVTIDIRGPYDHPPLARAYFDPGYIRIDAPAEGHHTFTGALWVHASPETPAFLSANLTLTAEARSDTALDYRPLGVSTVLVLLSADWAPGLDAQLQASHVRIPAEGGEAMGLLEVVNSGNADETVVATTLLAPAGCLAVVEGAPVRLAPHERAPLHARLRCEAGWSGGQLVLALTPQLSSDLSREGRGVEVLWDVQNTSVPLPYPQPRRFGDEDWGARPSPFGGAFGATLALVGAAMVARRRSKV